MKQQAAKPQPAPVEQSVIPDSCSKSCEWNEISLIFLEKHLAAKIVRFVPVSVALVENLSRRSPRHHIWGSSEGRIFRLYSGARL